MIPEQNIAKFLETFDKTNKIHLRTFQVIKDSFSDSKTLLDFVSSLRDSGVNTQNLSILLESTMEGDGEETSNVTFDNRNNIEERFQAYLKGDECSCSENLEENFPKRQRIESASSEPSNEEEFIPGLGFEIEEDKIPVINQQVPQTVSKLPILNKNPSNKDVCKDTVFYQNILPETKIKLSIDLNQDADPSYLFPSLQCKLCGLRFGSGFSAEFGLHIDDHRRFTNALGEKVMLRREFFSSKSVNRIEKLDLTLEGDVEAVVWEKESPNCSICGKVIKKIWDDKLENWVLEQGTRINEREVAHKKCVY